MSPLSAFQSVRARLLALMAIIVLPVAVLSLVLASTTYRSVVDRIEASQIQTASNYAARARIWFRGVLRTLVTGAASIDREVGDAGACQRIADAILISVEGFRAVSFSFRGVPVPAGASCVASRVAGVDGPVMAALAQEQRGLPQVQLWGGPPLADARYDAQVIGGALQLIVHARNYAASGEGWEALVLADPALLDHAFEIGTSETGMVVALVEAGGNVIVSRGVPEFDRSWLPRDEIVPRQGQRFETAATDGSLHAYAGQMVSQPDLYVLARFDDTASRAARLQFFMLWLTPLTMLGLLFVSYAWAIQNHVVRGITGIEEAARRLRAEPDADIAAPTDPALPHDIRSVAQSFNAMVGSARAREEQLAATLKENRFLMRELHHRVKNSLQVIQSYLALSRRQDHDAAQASLAETEARVQVLSTAYRLALTDSGMRPVPVSPLAEEIVGKLIATVRHPQQNIALALASDASLVVDRVIPLGLALVEGVIAGLKAGGATQVTVRLGELDDGRTELRITTDGQVATIPAPVRIMKGLAMQLEASPQPNGPGDVMRWRFAA
jgi:two-component sensor histidine kinase